MSEREAFLRAIAADEGDDPTRLVFADWLDDHGEHEEADRQRKFPEAKKWLDDVCKEHNAGFHESLWFTYEQLLEFGRNVSARTDMSIEVSGGVANAHAIATAIRERIPGFWRAWSIVTGLPLSPDIEQKCYYVSGYCCQHEVYPDTHVAGPKSAAMIRAEEAEAQERLQQELQQELDEEEALRRVAEEREALRQQALESIQDELEKDRP